MLIVVQFSFFLLGIAIVFFSAVAYRRKIKLPEGRPNDVAPSHFARYGIFLIALLLISLFMGFYIGPKLPESYAGMAVMFVFGIMSGAMAMVYAFPFFMISPELKKENKPEIFKILKFAAALFVAILIAVAATTAGIILFSL